MAGSCYMDLAKRVEFRPLACVAFGSIIPLALVSEAGGKIDF